MQHIHLTTSMDPALPPSVLALGFFDGVHLAHRALLKKTVAEAAARGLAAAVFTFAGGLPGVKSGARLTSDEERNALFEEIGIEYLYTVAFEDVCALAPETFIETYLLRLCQARLAVAGFNFRFGKNAGGDALMLTESMRKVGGDALILPPFLFEGEAVSASRIRRVLEEGDPALAARLLGRPYAISTPVLHGKALGRHLGTPTLNQRFAPGAVIPRRGVYVCLCRAGNRLYRGVCNIGVRPTVECDAAVNAETYLLDFSGDLYGKAVTVEFLHFIRPEEKFASPEALQAQIAHDVESARRFFGEGEAR